MDVCKCIVPSRHRGTLNSRRAVSPLMWLVEGEEMWEASNHPQSVLPLNWGGTELNRTVTCMVLKATANDRRHLIFAMMNFVGLDLAFADQVTLADQLIGTSAHAPQRPMVKYTGMGTVGPGPHGLLRHCV
ncbi:uncharacterized protein TNCV_3855431 [Trichonephila clavipes]|nr:uncharacterized protein TNCV_3855431 [Trichonephila clavipes]